jgi:hypothetical protein
VKAKRFIVCSDIHGDMRDEHACAMLLAFTKDFDPEIRVINGDLWDFRNLRKGASDDEKAASMAEDWEAGIDFASRFFNGGTQNHFLRGNHDERIWDFSRSATGLIRDYADDGIKSINGYVKRWHAKMLPYDAALGVLELGKLRVVHGYFAGQNAAQAHARVYRNCLYGHTHAIEVGAIASLEPEEARGIGCLCIRDMDYVNKKAGKLRWSQGWAYGFLFEDGSYQLFQARRINGVFHVATQIKQY